MNNWFVLALTFFGLAVILAGCGNLMTSSGDITAVQQQYESQLMSIPGVVGVGVGECEGQPCLKVLVEEESPELEREIPKQLEGFKVDIQVTGSLGTQPK